MPPIWKDKLSGLLEPQFLLAVLLALVSGLMAFTSLKSDVRDVVTRHEAFMKEAAARDEAMAKELAKQQSTVKELEDHIQADRLAFTEVKGDIKMLKNQMEEIRASQQRQELMLLGNKRPGSN